MIIKGKSRSGPMSLAAHLGNAEKNERVSVLEARGTVAQDLRGALLEMDTYAAGSRCEKPLYHAAISPAPPHRLTPQQRTEAIDALEEKLGLNGHARVVVLHEKHGREHIHVVWSRIDLDRMKSVSDSHNYRKHEEVARDLERRFDHERVQGAHHERDDVKRPDRTPSRAELRQEERTGIKGKDVKAEVSELFRSSDGPEAFQAALEEKGYRLAQGDRRDFVIIDRAGGIHSLARRLDDVSAADVREFMAPLDRESFPTVEEAKRQQLDRRARREAYEEDKLEAAYGRGGDYVSQSTAAQRDFKRKQERLNKDGNRDPAWERVEWAEAEREREQQAEAAREAERRRREDDEKRQQQPDADARSEASPSFIDGIEMTDALQERVDRLLRDAGPDVSRTPDDPNRQTQAPGGGRTRSR
jgi:hypothetical protein